MGKKWKTLESVELIRSPFFRMRKEKADMGDGRVMPAYYIFDFADWVQLIPVTKDLDVVLVEQYRHAYKDTYLEIPGGSIEPNSTEKPEVAAVRELEEETGYLPGVVEYIGAHQPNPALQSNSIHTYLALDCEPTGTINLDPYEDLVVKLIPLKELLEKLDQGELRHSLIVASLCLARKRLLDLIP